MYMYQLLLLMALALFGSLRIGEAKNPGPLVEFSALNVISMAKNLELFHGNSIGVSCYTETCVTETLPP